MSSVSVRIDLDSELGELVRRLERTADVDKAGVMNALAEGLRTSTQERFLTESAPDGNKWKTSVRAAEKGGKTLTASGQLKNSIHAKSDATGAVIGTNLVYAATHQFGAERIIRARNGQYLRFQAGGRWVSVPSVHIRISARPFLGISAADEQEMRALLEEVFEEK